MRFEFKRATLLIIVLSTIFRTVNAFFLEITPLEAYNINYALFPEFGSITSPPMLGWIIQLFTNNLSSYSNLIIRLSAIICGSTSLWIIFTIGRRLKNEACGFYSVLLFSLSVYFNTFGGLFLVNESVLLLFFLLSIYFILEGFIHTDINCNESRILCNIAIVMTGLFIGLSALSLFYSIVLWPILIIYSLIYKRYLFFRGEIYISILITLLIILPYIIWNVNNDFIPLEYFLYSIEPVNIKSISTIILKTVILVNPFVLYKIITQLKLHGSKLDPKNRYNRIILFISVQLLVISIVLSILNSQYISFLSLSSLLFIFPASSILAEKYPNISSIKFSKIIKRGKLFTVFVFICIYLFSNLPLIQNNFSKFTKYINIEESYVLGYGKWNVLTKELITIIEEDINKGKISRFACIVDFDPFNASKIDFFLSKNRKNIDVKTIGSYLNTLKYHQITKNRGALKSGDSAFFIYNIANDIDLSSIIRNFEKVEESSSINITVNNRVFAKYKVIRLINYKSNLQ